MAAKNIFFLMFPLKEFRFTKICIFYVVLLKRNLQSINRHLNPASNKFLLTEHRSVTKIGIFYIHLLPGPLVKQKHFVAHTVQKSSFITKINFSM